MYRCLFL